MSAYVYKGAGHRLRIHRELFEKQEARVSGPDESGEDASDEDEPQRGPLSIAEIFGLKPT